jgi:hypothetical protein
MFSRPAAQPTSSFPKGDDLRRVGRREDAPTRWCDALRPLTSDRTVRRLVRALCDHDTWRALRRQRIGAEEAVDTAAELIAARLRAT